jgi:hypothetical protein
MWRAMVLAGGLALCLLGGEFMVVDRLVLAENGRSGRTSSYLDGAYADSSALTSSGPQSGRRVIVPPEWAPWGLMSAGVLAVLYGASLPKP